MDRHDNDLTNICDGIKVTLPVCYEVILFI